MEPPTPQCVGREFVRQYYTLLNHAPLHLHRFYSSDSSFVHGGIDSGTEAEVVKGQVEIHEKIVQLNFKDCHAKIIKVDSHKTLAEGVVVQVSGELSNNGEPMRRFVQTFVLAPQSPKKYYVHNDIFRYQDEVFADESETATMTTEEGRLEEPIQKQIIAAGKQAQQQPVNQVNQIPEPVKVEPPVIPVVQETFTQETHMNGSGGYTSPPVVDQPSMEVEEIEWKSAGEGSTGWKEPAGEWKEEDGMVEDEDAEEETEPPLTPVQEPTNNANEPISWSSRVKMGTGPATNASAGKPPVAPVAAAAPAPAAPVAAAPSSKEGTPFSQPGSQGKPFRGNRGNSQGRQSIGAPGGAPMPRPDRFKDDEPPQGRTRMMSQNSDQYQLFVGNLPHDCTEYELQNLFEKYGKVTEIRINKKHSTRPATGSMKVPPNFAFVVFEEMSSVEQAMRNQPTMLYGTHRLNIEEKKTKPGSGGPMFNDRMQGGRGERGSQDNLRGAGHPGGGGRGGGSGDRGRGSGGRGGRGRGDYGNRGRGGPPSDSRGSFRGGGPRN